MSPPRPDLSQLSTTDLDATLAAVDAGRLVAPLTGPKLTAAGLAVDRQALLVACADLGPAALRPVLAAVLAERRHHAPAVELVWTGPEPTFATTRDSRRVLDQLFRAATHTVLIAGFSFDHGRSLFAPLADAMSRGVTCDLFFDIPGDQRNIFDGDEERLVSAHVRTFIADNWPWSLRPRFFYDPRRFDPSVYASLHAKCVVVDDAKAYVTSANFTDRGQTRNTEVGALIDAPHFASQLAAHFRRCVHEGLFRQIPNAWLPGEEPSP